MADLLPYLKNGTSRIHLEFSVEGDVPSAFGGTTSPFLKIDDSQNFVKLIEGRFCTDAGSPIKKVHVLIQKDQYGESTGNLEIGNKDIDDYWQQFLSKKTAPSKKEPPVLFRGQLADNAEGIEPFDPLLFCSVTQRYFRLYCPECGSLLRLCRSDEFLVRYRLSPYSSTLKRYLFCSDCHQDEKRERRFYSLIEGAVSEAGVVKGYGDYLKSLENLFRIPDAELPCVACKRRVECHGEKKLAKKCVFPLSFYPFFMQIYDGNNSINATEYVQLISGRSPAEIEDGLIQEGFQGRCRALKASTVKSRTPFLFGGNNRIFLEVLFLKLSFLSNVFGVVFSGDNLFRYPDFSTSLKNIWVKFPASPSLLSPLYTYQVEQLDFDSNALDYFPMPISRNRSFFATIWFHALVSRRHYSLKSIFKMLTPSIMAETDGKRRSLLWESELADPVNIFYEAPCISIAEKWREYYHRSLELGLTLLKDELQAEEEVPIRDFLDRLGSLIEDVRKELTGPPSEATLSSLRSPEREAAISSVLETILEKWKRQYHSTGTPPGDRQGNSRANDWEESIPRTRIGIGHPELDAEQPFQGDKRIAEGSPAGTSKGEWEEIPATRISKIHTEGIREAEKVAEPSDQGSHWPPSEGQWEEIPETKVFFPKNNKPEKDNRESEKEDGMKNEWEDIQETRIILTKKRDGVNPKNSD